MVKKFGSGTRLVVTDKKPVPPSVTLYHNPKNKELLCVARDMFPKVLKMTWKEKGESEWGDLKQASLRVTTTIQEKTNTLSSLLISEKNGTEELQKYACQVEHESNSTAQFYPVVSTKGGNENSGQAVSDQVTCQPKTSNNSSDTDPNKKSELLTVSLSYCMLILKSLTYFGIMSVIIYKRSSQTS